MSRGLGDVQEIAASGKWGAEFASDTRDLFFDTLREAKRQILITTYTLGMNNFEVNEFFSIIEERLENGLKVKIIVNDDGKKNGTCSDFARGKIKKLKNNYSNNFFPKFFKSTKDKILHAKIVAIDNNTALIGSANISKGALSSNYEIMIKVGPPAAGKISLMVDSLFDDLS